MHNKKLFWLLVLGIGAIILACKGGGPPYTLAFSPASLPEARVGVPYSVTVKVSNNKTPVMEMGLAKGGLPTGLTFTFNEGKDSATISGTPKTGGIFLFDVGAACYGTNQPGQTGAQEYTLTIIGPTATPGPTPTGGTAKPATLKSRTPTAGATLTPPGGLGQTPAVPSVTPTK